MLLGLFSGLLIVAQAWLLASLLHALIIEHTPREQLILRLSGWPLRSRCGRC